MGTEIGETLRGARIQRGMELEEIERAIKIRVRYLLAMEAEAWERLPGVAYERGFLRTYASFLGLDGDALAHEYDRRRQLAEEDLPDAEPAPEPLSPRRRAARRPRVGLVGAIIAGAALAALGVVIVLGLTGNSSPGGGHGSAAGARTETGPASVTTTATSARPSQPAPASLRLQASGTVWVCLIDDRGRALIDGLTLSGGQVRGPYRAEGFKLTLGNGEVQMEADGRPVAVPKVAEPLGYEITRQGVRQLAPAARPTCT